MSEENEKASKSESGSEIVDSLDRVKDELRKWYGLLSMKELVTNKALIQELETLEKMIIEQKAALC